jgi:hypothetical protein
MFMYSDVNAARNILVGAASVVLTGQAHPTLAWYDIRTALVALVCYSKTRVACWGYRHVGDRTWGKSDPWMPSSLVEWSGLQSWASGPDSPHQPPKLRRLDVTTGHVAAAGWDVI